MDWSPQFKRRAIAADGHSGSASPFVDFASIMDGGRSRVTQRARGHTECGWGSLVLDTSGARSAACSNRRDTTFASACATRQGIGRRAAACAHSNGGRCRSLRDVIVLATPWEATADALQRRGTARRQDGDRLHEPAAAGSVGTLPRHYDIGRRGGREAHPGSESREVLQHPRLHELREPRVRRARRHRCSSAAMIRARSDRLRARQSARLRHDRRGSALAVAMARGDGDVVDQHGVQVRREPALGVQAAEVVPLGACGAERRWETRPAPARRSPRRESRPARCRARRPAGSAAAPRPARPRP